MAFDTFTRVWDDQIMPRWSGQRCGQFFQKRFITGMYLLFLWGHLNPEPLVGSFASHHRGTHTLACSQKTQDQLLQYSCEHGKSCVWSGRCEWAQVVQDEQENSRSLCLLFYSSDFPFSEPRLNSVSTSLMIQAFRAQWKIKALLLHNMFGIVHNYV